MKRALSWCAWIVGALVVGYLLRTYVVGTARVVGSSIGLPAMWVMVAVTLGGSTMGLVGMLVFIPLCSVLYTLLRSSVNRRLAAKRLAAAQSAPPPAACPSSGDCPPPLAEEEKESDSQ